MFRSCSVLACPICHIKNKQFSCPKHDGVLVRMGQPTQRPCLLMMCTQQVSATAWSSQQESPTTEQASLTLCSHICRSVVSVCFMTVVPPPPTNPDRWHQLLRGGDGPSLLFRLVPAGDARAQLLSPWHTHHRGLDRPHRLPGQHVPSQCRGAVQLPQRYSSFIHQGPNETPIIFIVTCSSPLGMACFDF